MPDALKLLLPALIPSWRFFDTIAPSPRIEFARLETAHDTAESWQEFRPRPAHLPVKIMLQRLFWNPRWNETLFLVSCAERIMENGSEHSIQEIATRIKTGLGQDAVATAYFQFRLVFVSMHGESVQKRVTYTSPVYGAAAS